MTIFKTVVGSQLHGFATEDSDTDYVTVYAEPLTKVLSLYGDAPKGNQSHGDDDSTTYELRHFCRLLVKGNPTVYDALYSNLRNESSVWDKMMVRNAHRFIDTNNVYNATHGYVHSTMKEAGNGEFTPIRRGKKALAALRVLRQGKDLLQNGSYDPRGQIDYDFAISLKNGDEQAILDAQELVEVEKDHLNEIFNLRTKKTADIDWINSFLFEVYVTGAMARAPKSKLILT